jgi:protein tyrosine/serine phosphatase
VKKIAVLLFICVSIEGCGYLSYVKDPFVDIPQFIQVDERLYRGGKPNRAGLQTLQAEGVQTVISLQGKSPENDAEKQRVENLGMNFVSLPMSVYQRPSDEDIFLFLETVLDPKNQPVFVHCHSGRDRTGVIVAVYRVLVDGWGPKQAYKEAKKYGFWPYKGDAVLKNFIHQLRDKEIYFRRSAELMEYYGIE